MPLNKETKPNQTKGLVDYINKSKERLITAANISIGNISIDRKTIKTRKQMGKKNNCMDISSDKLVRLLTRIHGHCYEREILI